MHTDDDWARDVFPCACPGDGRTVILEPPLSTGAGGRSPEKTSPGMVDRPSKRQGPGPGCGEVEDGVLAWHGGLDRPSVRTRPERRPSRAYVTPISRREGHQVLGLDTHALLLLPHKQPSGQPLPARLQVLCARARYPRGGGVRLLWNPGVVRGDKPTTGVARAAGLQRAGWRVRPRWSAAPAPQKRDRPGEGAPGRSAGRRAAGKTRRRERRGHERTHKSRRAA